MSEALPPYVRHPGFRQGEYPPPWGNEPSRERIAYLLEKHRAGGLTHVEVDELFEMLAELSARAAHLLCCG